MTTLKGKVAIVTGASRGTGKGIALGLGETGATVYVTGRTKAGMPGVQGLEGSIEETANEIKKVNGTGFALHCDHTDDNRVKEVFDYISEKEQRIDLLVNNVWGGYECMFNDRGEYIWEKPFWEQPIEQWDLMFSAGARAHYVSSRYAAKMMINQKHGLIVNLSNSESPQYLGRVIAAIYTDPALMEKTGNSFVAAKLGLKYGISDIDGKIPKPLSIESA